MMNQTLEATGPSVGEGPSLDPGTRINHYEIIRLLGRGGMGAVFLARDLRLGRRVAIKLLRLNRPEHLERLLTEARATARCQHENIVVIHEVGEHVDAPYLVLEYLDGKSLGALLEAEEVLPYHRAVEIACAIVRALACAHGEGIVHRDLKPDNVFLTEAGAVKVLDFGIAKVMREPATGPTGSPEDGTDAGTRTTDDKVAGTLQYMAPEQWGLGIEIDHRADLWACGLLLHQMICGRLPLAASKILSTPDLEVPMPSMAKAAPDGVPLELIEVVDRCLQKDASQRWQSAAELLAALAPLLPGRRAIELQVDESPYAGLASFQERDAGKFFGRSHEIAELVTRIHDRPLVAVVGASGVGKSSFVRAGAIPALKRTGEAWEALIVRPGRAPIEALAALIQPMLTLASHLADQVEEQRRAAETLRREPGHLGDVLRLRARRERRRLLLFVDQHEELYTQVADPAERAAFTACLSAVADDATSPLRVVLSIRADFFHRTAEDRRFADELARGLFFLGPPSRAGLREAIASPAELAGYRFERPAIIDEMIDHLEATPGALPLLQFAAARLWDTRDRERRLLTDDSYAAMGGVAGALASHADSVVRDLGPDNGPDNGPDKAPLVREILLRLVTAERTRAIVPLAELRALSRAGSEVQWLIDRLVNARLLVVQTLEGGAGATVEIVHESLVHGWPALRRWLDEHAGDAALVDQLRTAARQWDAKGRDPGLLWRGDALVEYQRWRARRAVGQTPLEAAFGAASVAAAARGRRIRRAITAGAALITAVFVVALGQASRTASRAQHEAEGLLRDSYREQGRLRVLDGDKLGALAPLAEAYRLGSTGPATRLLLEEAARPTRPRRLTLTGHGGKLWTVAYSPDGRWIATGSSDGTARLWDAATGAPRAAIPHDDRVVAVAFSPDSRLLATGGADRRVRVWDVIAGRELLALPSDTGTQRVAFSSGGALLAGQSQRTIKLWRMPDGAPAGELDGHDTLKGATFCGNGSCIVSWDDHKVMVWDPATRATRASLELPDQLIISAAVSRSGALIAIGTRAGELVLLRGDGSEITRRAAHDDQIFDIDISPDETIVATASNDRTARLWSVAGEPRGVLAGHRANVTRIRFTPAGDRIVTASADNSARVWSASGMLLGELTGHTAIIIHAAIRPDGSALATASWDHTAIVWDLVSAQELRPSLSARPGVDPMPTFTADGRRLAIARLDGAFSVIDFATGELACTAPAKEPLRQLVWTGDAQLGVIRQGTPSIELWNTDRCAVDATLQHPAAVTSISSPPGPRLVSVAEGVVRIWRGGQLEASFSDYPGTLQQARIDGDDVCALTDEPAAIVIDAIGAPAQRRIFRSPTRRIQDVWIDRRHGRVLAASLDQFLYVWDLATGALVRKLEGTGPLWAARLSPDGALVIGVGGISPIVWGVRDGTRHGQLEGHSGLVEDGEFIGDRLFVSIANHTALVWDIDALRPLTRLHDVDKIVVSSDRRSAVLVGAKGVRLWSPRAPAPDLGALAPFLPRVLH
ncbi:MAG TPA: protein kinase [Kofleriaceae bacterium]|nr:protein kinase [Kofleriaceae bacterium]